MIRANTLGFLSKIMPASSPRVLSIQSHVVSGYVGNKSATFPLQLLGFEVDGINSVQFSNHTGYKKIAGQILNEKDLDELADGLKQNGLDNYTHILTGYIGAESFLIRVSQLVQYLKTINPSLIYVCDPVMGDNGKLYVPENLLPVYKNTILALADIVTPNQFELELLTNRKIESVNDAWDAIDSLHAKGPKTIIVSSTELGDEANLLALASSGSERLLIPIPRLEATFTGTGDLFAALLLAWMHKSGANLRESLEKTVATLQAVLKRTLASDAPRSQGIIELKLVQSKSDIENPSVSIRANNV